jgi:VWFA-related protein
MRATLGVLLSILLVVLTACVIVSAGQQAPSAQNSPTIKANVNEVLIPVVVRDEQGHGVGGLTREDFRVFDDGKPQAINGFMVIRRSPDEPGKSASSSSSGDGVAVVPGATSPAQRFVVFLFDDLNLSSSDLSQAQTAVSKVLDTALVSADMAAVLTSSGTNSGLTRDRGQLRTAIMKLKVNNLYHQDAHSCPSVDYYQGQLILNGDTTALQAATENTITCAKLDPLDPNVRAVAARMAQQAAQSAVAVGEQDYRTNLDFLRVVIGKMGTLSGQRILILVSPGFLAPSSEAMALKSQVLDLAARGNVTINAIDTRRVYATNLDATREGGGSPLDARQQAQYLDLSTTSNENVMAELTDGTGGTFFHHNNNLEDGFTRLISGPTYLYLLAFSPEDMKSNGAYHRLKVEVNRAHVTLQARRGYFAVKPKTNE